MFCHAYEVSRFAGTDRGAMGRGRRQGNYLKPLSTPIARIASSLSTNSRVNTIESNKDDFDTKNL